MRTPSAKAKSSRSTPSGSLQSLITATVKLWRQPHLTYDQARYVAKEVRKTLQIERVKTRLRVVSRLSRDEERRLIQQAYRDKSSRGLLIKTLLMTGARVSEFANLRVQDFFFDEHSLLIDKGKGGKSRYVPILPELAQELKTHLGERQRGYLFESNRHQAYSPRRLAIRAVYEAAQVKDNPADLINVALETLIKEGYELPAFSTLDRLARRVRTLVNRRFFQTVLGRLTASDLARLDSLLIIDERTHQSPYNRLKQLPKQPTLSHLQAWLDHLEWLTALGDVSGPLADLPHLKVKHLAAEAKALAAGELKDFLPARRYTLLICLIQRLRVQARDSLAAMFIKRLNKILQKGKEALDQLRRQYKEKTAELVSLLAGVVTACDTAPSDEAIGWQVRSLLTACGSASQLLEDCEAITAYNADNYQPLLWRYWRSYRRTLFRLVRQLALSSTSQDQSLTGALKVALDAEARRREWLSEAVDLSFASERWQRTVTRIEDEELLLNRRHLEVCVFLHLTAELKSGDVSIAGSEEYADYREQLLTWEECKPRLAGYCRELGFAQTAPDFVANL